MELKQIGNGNEIGIKLISKKHFRQHWIKTHLAIELHLKKESLIYLKEKTLSKSYFLENKARKMDFIH